MFPRISCGSLAGLFSDLLCGYLIRFAEYKNILLHLLYRT